MIDDNVCPVTPGGTTEFPIIYTANEFLYVDDADPVELEEAGLDFELLWDADPNFYYLVQGSIEEAQLGDEAPAFRQHCFSLNPIHRGHPVDTPDPSGMGASGTLYTVPALKGTTDPLFFLEADVIRAIGAVSQGGHDAVNLSMGTYGCEGYDPGALIGALQDLDIAVVASAGNDGSQQPCSRRRRTSASVPPMRTAIAVASATTDRGLNTGPPAKRCWLRHRPAR